jgi:predicted DNA-binding protein
LKLSKETMNKLVKAMAKKQNETNKLNAGQLREAIRLLFQAMQDLTVAERTETMVSLLDR